MSLLVDRDDGDDARIGAILLVLLNVNPSAGKTSRKAIHVKIIKFGIFLRVFNVVLTLLDECTDKGTKVEKK